MLINIVLHFDGAISLWIADGNMLPRWVESSVNSGRIHGPIQLETIAAIEKFINDYSTNGNNYNERMPVSGLFRDFIVIKDPEQLQEIFAAIKKYATIKPDGQIILPRETFSIIKEGKDPKILADFSTAHKQGAGAGLFAGKLPADVGRIIGSYLDTKSAGRVARTKRSAGQSAATSLQEQAIKSARAEITFEEFKTRYNQQYKKETFKKFWGDTMYSLLDKKILSMTEVENYIKLHPGSRSETIYNELVQEHAINLLNTLTGTKPSPKKT